MKDPSWRSSNRESSRISPVAGHTCLRDPRIREVPDGRLVMTAGRFEVKHESLFDVHTEALQQPDVLLLWSNERVANW